MPKEANILYSIAEDGIDPANLRALKQAMRWLKSLHADGIGQQLLADAHTLHGVSVRMMMNEYMPTDYRKARSEKNIQLALITSQAVANNKKPRLDREMAVIPEQWNEFDNNISLTLYGNKMAYIDFNTESSVTIENEQMADFQKKIFRLLFKYLSKGR